MLYGNAKLYLWVSAFGSVFSECRYFHSFRLVFGKYHDNTKSLSLKVGSVFVAYDAKHFVRKRVCGKVEVFRLVAGQEVSYRSAYQVQFLSACLEQLVKVFDRLRDYVQHRFAGLQELLVFVYLFHYIFLMLYLVKALFTKPYLGQVYLLDSSFGVVHHASFGFAMV